jgi:putative FmdB family regulatory protein
MRTIRDFVCSHCGERSERLVDVQYQTIECPECHGDAVQQMGMPTVRLEGVTGSFPGAHEKWARIREDNAKIKARQNS